MDSEDFEPFRVDDATSHEQLAAMGYQMLKLAAGQRELWQIQRDSWMESGRDNVHKLMSDARQAWLASAAEAGALFAAASYEFATRNDRLDQRV